MSVSRLRAKVSGTRAYGRSDIGDLEFNTQLANSRTGVNGLNEEFE